MAEDRYPIPNVPVWQNPDRMSGALCFDQTRFLDAFGGVTREQVIAVLEHARQSLELVEA